MFKLIAAIMAVLILGVGFGVQPVEAAPAGCDGRINHYVSQPDVAANNGKVTHSLQDVYGNSYDSGSRVLGYWVKSDGPHSWVFRSGRTTTISYGQTVKACISQKAFLWWSGKTETWIAVSPENAR